MQDSASARHTGPFFITLSEDVIDALIHGVDHKGGADRSTLAVYLALRRGCNLRRDGWFWRGGHEQIGAEAGCSAASVKRAVRWLVEHQLIKVEVRTGRRGQLSHRYEIRQLGLEGAPALCSCCGSPFHDVAECAKAEVFAAGSPMTRPDGSPMTCPPGHARPGHGRVTGDPAEVDRGGKPKGGRDPLTPAGGRAPASQGAELGASEATPAELYLPHAIAWVRSRMALGVKVSDPTNGDVADFLKTRGRDLPAGVRGRRRAAGAAIRLAVEQLRDEAGERLEEARMLDTVRSWARSGSSAATWWMGWVHGTSDNLSMVAISGIAGVLRAWHRLVQTDTPECRSARSRPTEAWEQVIDEWVAALDPDGIIVEGAVAIAEQDGGEG